MVQCLSTFSSLVLGFVAISFYGSILGTFSEVCMELTGVFVKNSFAVEISISVRQVPKEVLNF